MEMKLGIGEWGMTYCLNLGNIFKVLGIWVFTLLLLGGGTGTGGGGRGGGGALSTSIRQHHGT